MRSIVLIAAIVPLAAGLLAISTASFAHPGGLNSEGCHNNRRTGGYHCHRARPAPVSNGAYYRNCAAARAAGAAPVMRGQPGYGRHLDRDNDGVGCE